MNRRVVVTGLGIISPIGNSVGEFWSSLAAGKCGIGPITKFDTEKYKAKLAAEVKGFDPLTYMEKNDVAHADLCTQFAVAAATQAVEDSGIVGTMAPERIGTYLGTGIGGIGTFLTEHTKLMEKGPRRISPYFIPMMIANMPASTIAMRYKFKNASMPSVTACSSAANAIGEALRAVRHGYCDAVLTGGCEATIVDIAVAGFTNMQALSTETDPTLASLPFDLRRKGFVMGEGAGCLVIEEYEHAVNRGAHIYAELCGYGVTCDAYHMTAPEPDGNGGARALAQAFQEAGGTDEDRIYINAHGTGTPMNDLTETLAIKTAFGEERARRILISSTKSMTGHMLGAASGAEAVASVLALQEGVVPPTIGLHEPDPQCDLDYVPLTARKAELDLALSTSLGFGGHNACLAFRKIR